MKQATAILAATIVALGTTAGLPAIAQTGPATDAGQPYDKARSSLGEVLNPLSSSGELRVGVGQATLAFRAGAAPGQVGTSAGTSLDEGPYPYTTVSEPGDGWHSEPMAKAFVIEKPSGERLALVKTDLYLMQHSIHKRVADLVVDETGIDRSHLFLQGNHDHSHPYANSPSWGLCLFTDCFDLRQWSYMTRHIAKAITRATADLQPASIAAAKTSFSEVQGNVIGPACATTMTNQTGPNRVLAISQVHSNLEHPSEDHCIRAGFPHDHYDPAFATIRFDNADTGEPIGAMFSFGMHPESLDDGHGLTSADYAGMVERKIQDIVRQRSGNDGFVAGWFVGALGDVEPADGHQPGTKDWWRESFARTEDMANRIVDDAVGLFNKAASQGQAVAPATVLMPASRDLAVDIATVQLPPPEDQPYGPTNSYITEQGGWGVKIPSTRSGQETTSAWLTTVRLGEVLIAGFPGEPITDLSLNFKSRIDTETDNVYQGHEWPDAPQWVRERVRDNFQTNELQDEGTLSEEDGFEIPLMFSMTGDWTGYYVTKWEYENRNHYRESMTPYGADGAEYVVGAFVDVAAQLAGGPQANVPVSATRAADDAALDGQYAAMVAAEQSVRAYRAAIPPNQGDVGSVVSNPADAAPYETTSLRWVGGSNAVDLPRVEVQRQQGDGWVAVNDSVSNEVVVRLDSTSVVNDPSQANPAHEWTWTATWEVPWNQAPGTYRFVVAGEYRSDQTDPANGTFFDPLGADRAYEATSQPFQVLEEGPIPATEVDPGGGAVTLTFEPTYRNNPDPDQGETLQAVLDDGEGQQFSAPLAYSDHGLFRLDKTGYPSGDYTLEIPEGAWKDPAGNPSEPVSVPVTVG